MEFNFYKYAVDPLQNILEGFDRAGAGIAGFFGGLIGGIGAPKNNFSYAPAGGSASDMLADAGRVSAVETAPPARSIDESRAAVQLSMQDFSPEIQGTILAIQRQMTAMGTPASMETLSEGRTMELAAPPIVAALPQRELQGQAPRGMT